MKCDIFVVLKLSLGEFANAQHAVDADMRMLTFGS